MTPTLAGARLDGNQREVLARFSDSPLAQRYYFTGGTALAGLYLHHRDSEDLDFFSDTPVAMEELREFVLCLPETEIVHVDTLHERRLFLLSVRGKPLKMEFTAFRMPRLHPLHALGKLRVDPIEELYVNKLLAFVDRKEPKDEVDIYFLLQLAGLPPLAEAISAAEQKSSLRGLRYMLQRRLLNLSEELPPTTPATTTANVAKRFKQEAEQLIAISLEE